MGKFKEENDFATPFGTTTSDGFHVDSDAVRYEPDVVDSLNGLDKDGNHASVETALGKRVQSIILNGTTYTSTSGVVDLGDIEIDSALSGITISSGTSATVEVNNKVAKISLVPASLVYDKKKGNLTIIDEFGTSGTTIPLGLDRFVQSATFDPSTYNIKLIFNDSADPLTINVSGLVDTYSGDGTTIVANKNVFSVIPSAMTKINNALSGVSFNDVSAEVSGNVAYINHSLVDGEALHSLYQAVEVNEKICDFPNSAIGEYSIALGVSNKTNPYTLAYGLSLETNDNTEAGEVAFGSANYSYGSIIFSIGNGKPITHDISGNIVNPLRKNAFAVDIYGNIYIDLDKKEQFGSEKKYVILQDYMRENHIDSASSAVMYVLKQGLTDERENLFGLSGATSGQVLGYDGTEYTWMNVESKKDGVSSVTVNGISYSAVSGDINLGTISAETNLNLENGNASMSLQQKTTSSMTANEVYGQSSIALGTGNQLYASKSLVDGENNTVYGSNNIVVGKNISAYSLSNSVVGGEENYLSSNADLSLFGHANNVQMSNYSSINGDGNKISKATYTIVGGNKNSATTENYSSIQGLQNNISNDIYLTINGAQNSSTGNTASTIYGNSNLLVGNGQSEVIGLSNTAQTSKNSLVVGNSNTITGASQSVVLGHTNLLSQGDGNSVMGISNTVNAGDANIVGGQSNTISGTTSQNNAVFGIQNTVNGKANTVGGQSNNITANLSSALGLGNDVKGIGDVALGSYNTLSATNSYAIGYGLSAQNEYEVALGRFNVSEEGTVFSIGNGSATTTVGDENYYSNAFDINESGDVHIWYDGEYVTLQDKIGKKDLNIGNDSQKVLYSTENKNAHMLNLQGGTEGQVLSVVKSEAQKVDLYSFTVNPSSCMTEEMMSNIVKVGQSSGLSYMSLNQLAPYSASNIEIADLINNASNSKFGQVGGSVLMVGNNNVIDSDGAMDIISKAIDLSSNSADVVGQGAGFQTSFNMVSGNYYDWTTPATPSEKTLAIDGDSQNVLYSYESGNSHWIGLTGGTSGQIITVGSPQTCYYNFGHDSTLYVNPYEYFSKVESTYPSMKMIGGEIEVYSSDGVSTKFTGITNLSQLQFTTASTYTAFTWDIRYQYDLRLFNSSHISNFGENYLGLENVGDDMLTISETDKGYDIYHLFFTTHSGSLLSQDFPLLFSAGTIEWVSGTTYRAIDKTFRLDSNYTEYSGSSSVNTYILNHWDYGTNNFTLGERQADQSILSSFTSTLNGANFTWYLVGHFEAETGYVWSDQQEIPEQKTLEIAELSNEVLGSIESDSSHTLSFTGGSDGKVLGYEQEHDNTVYVYTIDSNPLSSMSTYISNRIAIALVTSGLSKMTFEDFGAISAQSTALSNYVASAMSTTTGIGGQYQTQIYSSYTQYSTDEIFNTLSGMGYSFASDVRRFEVSEHIPTHYTWVSNGLEYLTNEVISSTASTPYATSAGTQLVSMFNDYNALLKIPYVERSGSTYYLCVYDITDSKWVKTPLTNVGG